jgi:hypothetical protein
MNFFEIAAIAAGAYFLMKGKSSGLSPLEAGVKSEGEYVAPEYSTMTDAELIQAWSKAPGIEQVLGGRYYDTSGNLYRGIGNSYWYALDTGKWTMYDTQTNSFETLSAAPWQTKPGQSVEEVVTIAPANQPETVVPAVIEQPPEVIVTVVPPPEPAVVPDEPYWPPAAGRYLVTDIGYSSMFVGDNQVMNLCTWFINAYRAADMEAVSITTGGLKTPVHPRGFYSLAELNALVVRKAYDANMFQHYVSYLARGMNSLNQWNSGILENYFKWPIVGADHVDYTYGTGINVYFDTPDQFWAVIKGIVFSVLGSIPDWRSYGGL